MLKTKIVEVIQKDDFTFYKPTVLLNDDPVESIHQINLINWIEENHPELFLFATVNERNSSKANMVKLKRQGLKTGVPDLYISKHGNQLFIEMKRHNGVFSDLRQSQRDIITEMKDKGEAVVVCFGFLASKLAVIDFLESLK